MIEGIKFEIGSDELKKYLADRVVHHEAKAKFYDEQGEKMKEAIEAAKEAAAGQNMTNNLSDHTFVQSAKSHRSQAKVFGFMRDHVVPNEVYRLEEKDLHRLEITSMY